MSRECRGRLPSHRLQRKPLVRYPGMHHDTCVTQVPWCMSGSLTRGGVENGPGVPGACATLNFKQVAHTLSDHYNGTPSGPRRTSRGPTVCAMSICITFLRCLTKLLRPSGAYASPNYIFIGLHNDSLPVRHQAIRWKNAENRITAIIQKCVYMMKSRWTGHKVTMNIAISLRPDCNNIYSNWANITTYYTMRSFFFIVLHGNI